MEKEFVSYDQGLELKHLGFDEDCFASFFIPNLYSIKFTATTKRNSTLAMGKDGCTAPLKQQVFRFFRNEYGYHVDFIVYNKKDYASPITKNDDCEFSFIVYKAYDNSFSSYDDENPDENFQTMWDTYEEAENACIDKLIELAKQQDK